MGVVVGRVANRIQGGVVHIDGKAHEVTTNEGDNTLHGGGGTFSHSLWRQIDLHSKDGQEEDQVDLDWIDWPCDDIRDACHIVLLQYVSEDGENGFPGRVVAHTAYIFPDHWCGVLIAFSATTSSPTPVNLCHHAYWNLDPVPETIKEHSLFLHTGDRYQEGLSSEFVPVSSTPYDVCSHPTLLSDPIESLGGIDHCYLFADDEGGASSKQPLRCVGSLLSSDRGLRMQVHTTKPAIQVYTANGLGDDGIAETDTIHGIPYVNHSSICLETQFVPNALALASHGAPIASSLLLPTQTYAHTTIHSFT